MAPTRLLVAAVCALAAHQATGFQIVADAVDAAGRSIVAAGASGAWQSAGVGTAVDDLNTVYLRVRRTDGGAIADCLFTAANLKLFATGTAVDFTGLAKGTPVFKGSFCEIPVTISDAVTAAQAGLVDVKDAGSAFTCASVASSASASALTTFNVGAPLTGVLAATPDVIGSIVDYASHAKVPFLAFNAVTNPKLTLSGTGVDGSNLATDATGNVALSSLGAYFTYPAAMASVQVSATHTTDTLTLALTGLNSLLPGVYEFSVNAGAVTASTYKFGGARFRFIVGSIPLVYNAATMRPATQLAGTNASTVIYATNATKLGVSVCGGHGGADDAWYTAQLFSGLYDAVYPYSANSAEDVSALFVGYSDASAMLEVLTPVKAANFTLTAAVGEGMYVFHRKAATIIHDSLATPVAEAAQRNLVIVVDRTAPTAVDATFSGGTQSVGSAGYVVLPTGMFTDAISDAPAKLTVVSTRFIGGDSQGYICSSMVPLSTATCTATAVRAPAGNLQVAITVADEAGNEAVAVLTIPIATALVPVVTVADNRGVFTSTTLKTGSTATLSGTSLVLTVVATFTDPLSAAPSLAISDSHNRVPSGHLSGNAVISANKRVFTYTVTIAAVAQDDDISIKVAAGAATRAADSVTNVADSSLVHVKIDTTKPTQTGAVASLFAAAVGQPFFAYIPTTVFSDSGTVFSAAQDITIVSGTTSDTVGLTVTGGKAGRAYISGTAASVPSLDAAKDTACGAPLSGLSWVKFAVAVADEAGNLMATTGVFCVQVTTIASTASLSVSRNALTYAEDASAISLDSVAAFSYANSAYKVYISLETPDVGSATDEILAIAPTSGLTIDNPYSPAAATNGLVGSITATAASANAVAASDVQAALRAATYANTMDTLTPGYRTVRIVVTAYDAARQPVLSSVSKTIYVTNVNSAPVVASASALAVTWSEGDSFFAYGQVLAYGNAISVTDADDGAGLVSATLRIATTASAGNYGACDPARDSLALPSDYLPTPVVYGVWSAAACALVLKPIAGATATPAQFSAALSAVLYRNSDRYDPTNGVTDTQKARAISIIAIDNAANLKASAPATSVATTGTITPTLVDDKPFFICEKLYGPGGMGYSKNETAGIKVAAAMSNANLLTAAGCPGDVVIRKTVLPFRAAGSATLVFTIPVDFSLVSSRVFANGAMYDYDTLALDATINAAAVTLAVVDSVGATGSPHPGISVPASLTAYDSATGVGSFTITIAEASAAKGEFGVQVTYSSSGNKFVLWFDARARLCVSDVATYGAATTLAVLASQYILDPNQCSSLATSFATTVDAAGSGVASYVPGQYIHMPASAATWSTGSVGHLLTAGKGTGSTFNPNFNFLTLNASLAAQRYAIENAKVPATIASSLLASTRAAARGAVSLYFEKNSFSTTSGSFPLSFQPLGWAAAQTLPAGATGEILDANQVFELNPAGMQFAVPMRMHMFVGDTPVGYTRTLRVASRKDITDATRGWQAWEAASGVTFDPATGLLSGNSSHFSAFASFLVPIAASPSVSKVVSMGGSCPNDCSGHGYCRAQGSCECFAGYNGVDCSLRTCPVAESWDAGSTAVHEAKECSERGACNGKTGVCACNAGFEGAACQRMACPGNCNSHGKCTLLGHLPQVQGAGYSMWEAARLTKCVCDAGYTGIDCTERICPFGDDPETTCNTDRQVQKVVLDFGSIPASTTPVAAGLYDTDELALVFQTPFGQNLSVPRVSNVFDPTSGAPAFQRALKSLPGFAVSDVAVTGVVADDKSSVTYLVTFDGASLSMALAGSIATRLTSTGNTVPGNQALLICPVNSAGSMGCQSPGCRPMYKQARLLQQPSGGVTVSPTAILQQPSVGASVVTTGKWAVIVHVTIRYRAETGTQSYSVTSELYQDSTLTGASLPETPLPPANTLLRTNVPLVYGLEVNFDAGTILDGTYDFSWRLPSCTVTQKVSADVDLELAECSRRGVCDRKAGACKCFSGYAGANCGMQTVVV